MKATIEYRQHNELFPGGDLAGDAWEFALAMAAFQKATGRRYPTWSEVLQVAKALGYRRETAPPPEIEP